MTQESTRVLVTAGASGIGRAIAETFLAENATVFVCDIDEGALVTFGEGHPAAGTIRADVADAADVDALFDGVVDRCGGIDVLVNNAGIGGPTGPIESLSYDDWRRCVEVNLDGTFLCARRAAAIMKEQGAGSIVNISSTAGLMGYPMRTPYVAAKWAVIGLTKSLAIELGPFGVRVNAICPGSVEGPRMDGVIEAEAAAKELTPDEVREGYLKTTSLRTFIDPGDIAASVLFLCSPAGAKISGQALSVDGHTESLAH